MKKNFTKWILILSVFLPCCSSAVEIELTPLSVFADAFKNQQSNLQVMQEGVIIAVLSDDLEGDRHQRMIIRLGNDKTLLIAHNIDLAPRVPDPVAGKTLRFFGEYEWNDEGGVVHWTHRDPDGVHVDGWIEFEGVRYGGEDATGIPFVFSTVKSTGHHAMGTGQALVDLRGRGLGCTWTRRGAGVYLMKFPDCRHGSIRFSCK